MLQVPRASAGVQGGNMSLPLLFILWFPSACCCCRQPSCLSCWDFWKDFTWRCSAAQFQGPAVGYSAKLGHKCCNHRWSCAGWRSCFPSSLAVVATTTMHKLACCLSPFFPHHHGARSYFLCLLFIYRLAPALPLGFPCSGNYVLSSTHTPKYSAIQRWAGKGWILKSLCYWWNLSIFFPDLFAAF